MKARTYLTAIPQLVLILCLVGTFSVNASTPPASNHQPLTLPAPRLSTAVAFDTSFPLRDLAARQAAPSAPPSALLELPLEQAPLSRDQGHSPDGALQAASPASPAIDPPILNFEGLSNTDNFNVVGFRVNPPSNTGDAGPQHYIQMVNLTLAVYNKAGSRLLGPLALGVLWQGFTVADCAINQGDPIVLYDQLAGRWLFSQVDYNPPTYHLCLAVSTSGDPTGAYYRYAFNTGSIMPNFPKYGVWTDSYLITTRDFANGSTFAGVSIYAVQKSDLLVGDPAPTLLHFPLDATIVPAHLIGDGLLPADIDGSAPAGNPPAPIIGTMDDGGPYAAPFDGLNVYELAINWGSSSSLTLEAQLPVAGFDSIFPCAPSNFRDCLPQPGITDPTQYLDVLSYRQRPSHRLAYRHMGGYESLVTSQAVEASTGIAGLRWYEIHRLPTGAYSLYQQGTFTLGDGVHRWMGSIAQDQVGNIALGYSVVNGVSVFPGIRYTGRTVHAPLGQMNLGEGVIINGSGVQTTTNSRWGDYTSMNVDPVDDCTFWYVNEYYTADGQAIDTYNWQTRIASFKLPNCSFRTFLPLLKK